MINSSNNTNNDNLKSKAITSTTWKFAERIIAQGISVVVSIILARLLLPSDYGVVSIVLIFFAFSNVLISGGLNTALIQKKDADELDYSSVFVVSEIIAIIIYSLLFFIAPTIAELYGQPLLVPIIRVMGLILPVNALKAVLCAYVSSTLQFKKFFFATIGGTIVSAFVGIYMAVNGYGAWALVAQQMTNAVIDTVILLFVCHLRLRIVIQKDRVKPLWGYGWKILLSSLIDTAYAQASPLFIGIRFSSADLSFYNKGQMFPSTISSTVNSTLSAVLFPVMSRFQSNKEKLLDYTRLFLRVTSYLIFPMMIGFFAVSDNFVVVVLTEKWLPMSVYLKIFCVSYMFIMIATGNCETIKAMGRSDVFLIIEIAKKVCYFLILAFFIIFSSSPVLLAISQLICTFVAILINTYPNRKLIGYSYKKQLLDLLPNLFISLIMGITVYLMNYIQYSRILVLVLQILTGIIVYVLLSYLTRNKSFFFLLGYVKSLFKNKRSS